MRQRYWRVLSTAGMACMIAVVAASLLLGACDKMIECASGNVPMRCHWAYIATATLGATGFIPFACSFAAKDKPARRLLAVCSIAVAAATAFALSPLGIGICPGGMQCQETAPVVWGLCAASVAVGLVQIAKADPNQDSLPKMEI